MQSTMVRGLKSLEDISAHYDLIFCDVWGVVHNGVSCFKAASDALHHFRQKAGGKVILLTNAPRPGWWVKNQLNQLQVREDAYDAIVTSGDVTHYDIERRGLKKIFALGPEKDLNFYDDLDVDLVSAEEAELIVITGLIDDQTETPDDYLDMLTSFKKRGLEAICANPDIVVELGDRLIYCGGALAEKYKELGGIAHYFGKPHAPIYERAFAVGAELLGRVPEREKVLAVGDGIATDVKGANNAGLDCLFVTGGIHSAEAGPLRDATPETVQSFLESKNQKAEAYMPQLKW